MLLLGCKKFINDYTVMSPWNQENEIANKLLAHLVLGIFRKLWKICMYGIFHSLWKIWDYSRIQIIKSPHIEKIYR